MVTGYRQLSVEELLLIESVKALGVEIDKVVTAINEHYDRVLAKFDTPGAEPSSITEEEEAAIVDAIDWVREGRRQMQVASMLLVRGIARPKGF